MSVTMKEDIMKLAEALILRADCQKKIEQLKQRLMRNAKIQEGEKPAEEPKILMEEFEDVAKRLTTLIQQINQTNSTTVLRKGLSLSDAIAERDISLLRQGIYRDLAQAATVMQDRHTKSEVKFKSAVAV